MKKLGKLSLKKEKMLSHEELVSFKGGSGPGCGTYVWNVCVSQIPQFIEDCAQNCGGDPCLFHPISGC